MLDIRYIKDNPEIIDKKMEQRGGEKVSAQAIALYEKQKALQQTLEEKRNEMNKLAKPNLSQEERDNLKKLGAQIKELSEEHKKEHQKMVDYLHTIPNSFCDSVPIGESEEDNVELRRYDATTPKPANAKHHEEIVKRLLSKSDGAMLSGSRFAVFKGELAKLSRVLASWLLEENVKAGYLEMQTPLIVNEETLKGMGVLPKFGEDLFALTNGQYLIPTGEATLTNILKEVKKLDYPIRFTSHTQCFRAEAGAAGRDTTGIIRLHQFGKVEVVSAVKKEQSEKEHERMIAHVESLLQKLGLSYRSLLLCSGDMGFHSYKTVDIEVFMPGLDRYVEISSCSQCYDYQARRMGVSAKLGMVTLNGSALPLERTLAAIIENYYQGEYLQIPEVLVSAFGGDRIELS